MRVLQVIHGYPIRFNAGSEIYTSVLSRALSAEHEVHVFTREEDSFSPDYSVRSEPDASDSRVTLHLVNLPRTRDRYRHAEVDQRFAELLTRFKPDVVHVGHLNHLSTSLVTEAARKCPVVFYAARFLADVSARSIYADPSAEPAGIVACLRWAGRSQVRERCYAKLFGGAQKNWKWTCGIGLNGSGVV